MVFMLKLVQYTSINRKFGMTDEKSFKIYFNTNFDFVFSSSLKQHY